MNAPQDVWALPLAVRMVSKFRTTALTYIRVATGAYDEATGSIAVQETPIPAAGAVVETRSGERNGVQQANEIDAWIDHATVPWPISSTDQLEYLGRRWKITRIVSYGSGGNAASGPIYIMTLDGKTITTIDGKPLVVQPGDGAGLDFSMYASNIVARAE